MSSNEDLDALDACFDAQERWTPDEQLEEEVFSLRHQLLSVMRRPPQDNAVRKKLDTRFDDEISKFFPRFLADRKSRRRQFREFELRLRAAIAARDPTAAALAMASFYHVLGFVKRDWDVMPYMVAGSRKTIATNKRRRVVSTAQIEEAIRDQGSVAGAEGKLGITRQAIEKRIPPERVQMLISMGRPKSE